MTTIDATKNRLGFVVWFTGLPAAGKSTVAKALVDALAAQRQRVHLLDSDTVRVRLLAQSTYSEAERDWFYAQLVRQAQRLSRQGINVVIAATASRQRYRDMGRGAIARFVEVYVDCPPAVCRARDPKSLWARVDRGEIANLPGADAPYEPPTEPELTLRTDRLSVAEAVAQVVDALQSRGYLSPA